MTLKMSFWAKDRPDLRLQVKAWAEAEPKVASHQIRRITQLYHDRWEAEVALTFRESEQMGLAL